MVLFSVACHELRNAVKSARKVKNGATASPSLFILSNGECVMLEAYSPTNYLCAKLTTESLSGEFVLSLDYNSLGQLDVFLSFVDSEAVVSCEHVEDENGVGYKMSTSKSSFVILPKRSATHDLKKSIFKVSLASPTTGISTWIILPISAGSMST